MANKNEQKGTPKCRECRQYISEVVLYNEEPHDSLHELEALEHEPFSIHKDHGTVEGREVPSIKVTCFTIYDKYAHVCPFFTGLIEKGVKLYFSGYIKSIDNEDPSIDNGISVTKIGPIKEWWILGYDGGDISIIGLTTEFAMYYLIAPSSHYEAIFKNVQQKTNLAKLVIEFLLDFGSQNPKFEDLIQHLKNCNKFPEVEEFLFQEAEFICNQILSYDEDISYEEVPMISFSCIQSLINLTGITLGKPGTRICRKDTNEDQKSTITKVTATELVREVFENTYQIQIKNECKSLFKTKNGAVYQACKLPDCDQCNNGKAMKTINAKPNKYKKHREDNYCHVIDNELDINGQNEIGDKPVKHKECSKQILHGVEWLKKISSKYNDCQSYSSASIDDIIIQQGDYVMLNAEDPHELLRIAKVVYMYDSPLDGAMFHAHFFCRGTDTILGKTADRRELFVVDDCDDYPLGCIVQKAEVEFRKITEDWASLGSKTKLPLMLEDNGKNYFFTKIYDYEFSRFRDYKEQSMELENPCESCNWQNELKRNETPAYKDKHILWRNEVFKIGTAVFLEPGQTKPTTEYLKEEQNKNADNILYPELYRKKGEIIRGSNFDTPEPFTVGLIEDIKNQKSDIKVKVRMFYRPEDTYGSVSMSYVEDINYLFWSNHVIWTTFKNVAGKCFVAYRNNKKSVKEWSEKGPFRFYFSKAYNHKTFEIYEVPLEGKRVGSSDYEGKWNKNYNLRSNRSNKANDYYEIPLQWEQLENPLKCLDIYAGCGGLSEGLHQAGVSKTLWAIEKETAPAQAFHLNNPECHVYTDDCNIILRTLLSDKGKDISLPARGDVELIVGGPPCQGFSAMNRFNTGQQSHVKNSQIITYLSYCDYYRPKYFIFENVRNFVSYKKNQIFLLTLRCLLAIGYQISFGILQAGNFGVPQTRRRFILIGAAPGYTLPNFPEPLHVFSRSGTLLSIVVDGLRYDTGIHITIAINKKPPRNFIFQLNNMGTTLIAIVICIPGSMWSESLPYRTMCVRDAIGDLPAIQNGSMNTEILYDVNAAKSHFQRSMRKTNKTGFVRDHICKDMSPIVEARISHIPTYPGADWRDLPNKTVQLRDGSESYILKYLYKTKDQKKTDPPRGVCKCAIGNSCDPYDRQYKTLIPWCLAHTADRHNNWTAVYGRLEWDGFFGTTISNPEPMGTQGRVLHPEQNRVVSVRECARSQGFQDDFKFAGNVLDKHRQIGNAVPPPLALAIGREIIKVCIKDK